MSANELSIIYNGDAFPGLVALKARSTSNCTDVWTVAKH
jgi:hypothetical protein